MAKRVVDVLVPVALDQTYSYRVPEGLELAPGDLVTVPLGARMATAVTWAENPKPNPRLDNRMKDVEAKLDVPPLKPELRKFIDWVSAYTLSPRGMVLRMALRMGEHLGPARERVGVRIAGPPPQRMTAARERVLALLADGLARGKRDVAEAAGVSPGVIDALVDEGTLESLVLPPDPVARRPDPDFSPPDFTPAQREGADTLRATVAAGGYGVTLLDGVTGAGKTQVYFEAVAEIVRRGKQALVLVPEIALTAQFLDRFAERFGVRPAEWHSQLSQRLRARTWNAVATGEQALLFLNRRGYAPLTLCRQCGFRLACPNCDAWLVDHRFRRRLVCHHCGFSMPPPAQCPQCQAADSFVAVGPGVERLEQEAAELFPESRILVLSSDLVESIERLRQELDDVAKGRFDIIIGTQLVAKGHHFPRLNLVGVVDADLGLANGDPRAAERTFQLLHQVIGRAGREDGRGIGYLQTHQPEHPVMRALVAADRDAFYTSEIELREKTHYPPFGRLASLLVSAGERPAAEVFARRLAASAPQAKDVRVLGPAEAPLAVVRGRHRFRLLVKSPRRFDLSAYLREWLAGAPRRKGNIKLEVDVDPQSFL